MRSNQSTETTENRFLGTISTSSIRNLLPRSISKKKSNSSKTKLSKSNAENTPPADPNIQGTLQVSHSVTKMSASQQEIGSEAPVPKDPPAKGEIVGPDSHCELMAPLDPPVKVVVRIRPTNEGDRSVKKVSSDTLSVGDRKFMFDSVIDSNAKQEDVFELVGVPLVKNALAGYNTTILSCGQTGSGKTYTLWGPPSAMVEDPSSSSHQGIVPRIFQMLFSEIQREQENSEGKQINYQCRCSFLEIYNEQIGDLLDPTQRNLEIRDDAKNGLYVENLTEEYVTSYDDVTQILIKGLSSRKVGATSLNSKSSRSHVVFTFVIESWCKGTSSKGFSSSKTSRISLVDLAGLDRKKVDEKGRQIVKEGKHLKKSLSQLGHLVNVLAKGGQSGNVEDTSYKGSCLTHLLRESVGGNAKLTVICAISPENKNSVDTLKTLRFGQRVKFIRNEPVINEIREDDVNDLSDQIRQLKEELIRARSNVHTSVGSQKAYFHGRNVRESLNQLRVSLNRSLILSPTDNDSDEEVNINEEDVRELYQHLEKLHGSEENIRDTSVNRDSIQFFSMDESCETDVISSESEIEEVSMEKSLDGLPDKAKNASEDNFVSAFDTLTAVDHTSRRSISISSCGRSPVLQDPPLSESPKLGNVQRKSMNMSANFVSPNSVSESSKLNLDVLRQSLKQSKHMRSSVGSSKTFTGPTETLAASLHRGLQIIDHHQRNSAPNKSSVSFSFEHLTLKPCSEVDKANASLETLPEEKPSSNGPSASFFCTSCRQRLSEKDSKEVQDSLKTWILAVNETPTQLTGEVTKETGNAMIKSIKREELENVCMEQAAKIEQLNQLVEQYKREKEEMNDKDSNAVCLEATKTEIVPYNEKLVRCNSIENNQPEMIKEVMEPGFENTYFDPNEKEALLKEIEELKSKLQSYSEPSHNKSVEKLRSSLLSRSIQLRRSFVDSQDNSKEELEKERQRWTEMESDWISLTDELRIDLESHRRRAEQVEMELTLEKKCTEELDDALHRAVLGHARMIEHYAELQEKYNFLVGKHRAIMEGIAEVKKAAAKAGKKGHGPRFAKSLAAELSALRVEREREREQLKKENKSLRIQLRDTAEAVHAAGELLVRLREAEHAASVSEENFAKVQEDNEKLKKQMDKIKRKHKMEMITMKQYLAESRLPESALQTLYREDSDVSHNNTIPYPDDDQAWRAEFGAIYQEHF